MTDAHLKLNKLLFAETDVLSLVMSMAWCSCLKRWEAESWGLVVGVDGLLGLGLIDCIIGDGLFTKELFKQIKVIIFFYYIISKIYQLKSLVKFII